MMEDDIDIEEHDVLDNPKIRDIFPDLSRVKMEVPDDIEDVPDEYNVPLDFEDDQVYVEVKKEQYSDEENNTDQNEVTNIVTNEPNSNEDNVETVVSEFDNDTSAYTLVQDEERYQFEINVHTDGFNGDGVIYNNKIILGSKPTPDYDILYEEALNSKVTVSLENWEEKLKESMCYCHECEILFPTVNALDAHKSVSHSFLVALETPTNTARKSTTKPSRYCNHCDKVFTDDTLLIKHLYELLPLQNYEKPTPEPLKINANSTRFKCIKCKKYFATMAAGKEHRKNVHPSCGNLNIICKVTNKIDNTERTPENQATIDAANNLVPKSVLFKCNVCQINFVSCYNAVHHSAWCKNNTEFKRCTTCKRKIRAKDHSLHILQHKNAKPGDKIRIYMLHKNISEKVYCKCPKCLICFEERAFWSHYGTCDGSKSSCLHCGICDILISQNSYPNHISKHAIIKDFLILTFFDVNDVNTNEMTHEETLNTTVVKEKLPLYYCKICGSFKHTALQRQHRNGGCKVYTLRFCDLCGLGFSKENYNIHRKNHLRNKQLTLNDFRVFNLTTGIEMDMPILKYHICKVCKLHFLTKEHVRSHNCATEPFEFCNMCNKKFNNQSYKSHLGFHMFNKTPDTLNKTPEKLKKIPDTLNNIPELLKKYNSIDNMWNVVYQCVSCNVVTTTYDSAVEHCQYHIMELRRPLSKICEICDFDILEPHFKLHKKLHTNKVTVNRANFTILTFNYEQLYTKDWMCMFNLLPKAHKYQILSKSIYRFSRRFKFNYITNFSSEDVKIYCEKCKTRVDIEDSKKHYMEKKCKLSASYVCRSCNLHFSTLQDCLIHEKHHETNTNTYKVLTFNNKKDTLFDQKLKNFELSTVSKALVKSSGVLAKHHKFLKSNSRKNPIKLTKTTSNALRKKPLRGFNRTMKDEAIKLNRIKLYRCEQCYCCVGTRKYTYKHTCSSQNKSTVRKCAICKENFHSRTFLYHMDLHKQCPNVMKKPLIIKFNPNSRFLPVAIIYKCECGLHFTSKPSFDKHMEECNKDLDVPKETCSKCDLLFPTDVLVSHLCKHHSKPMDIIVQTVQNNITTNNVKSVAKSPVTVKNSASVTTVCRCAKCDITYLNKKSIDYHFEMKHVNKVEIVTCKVCKLKFTCVSHTKHIRMHSKGKNYVIKIVDPISGRSVTRKGNNRAYQDIKDDDLNSNAEQANIKKVPVATKNTKSNESIPVATKNTKPNEFTLQIENTNVYKVHRCSDCGTCYRGKKRLLTHLSLNHKIPRTESRCQVCGLLFNTKLIRRHMDVIHSNGNPDYTIQIIDSRTSKVTTIKGTNIIPSTSNSPKRKLHVERTLRSKRVKRNNSIDDDEKSDTSKLEFESVDMTDDNETIADINNDSVTDTDVTNDPLNAIDATSDNENDSKDVTAIEQVLSKKVKDKINTYIKKYSSKLYRCKLCGLHFINITSMCSHITRHGLYKNSKRRRPLNCNICGLAFTVSSLNRHLYIHHTLMKLEKEFEILEMDEKSCITPQGTAGDESAKETDANVSDPDHILPDVSVADVEISYDVAPVENNPKIYYFKCADCNVCFIDDERCRLHCTNHVTLDTKAYIECKICNFQFLILSLAEHVSLHHDKEFVLDDLVINEYKSSDGNPRVEVYEGIDKLQSGLVSTTTDVADSSEHNIIGL